MENKLDRKNMPFLCNYTTGEWSKILNFQIVLTPAMKSVSIFDVVQP